MAEPNDGASGQGHLRRDEERSDSRSHEEQREQGIPIKGSDILSQTPVGHSVNGSPADSSKPSYQAEGGQRVPHSSPLRDGFPYLIVFNAVLAFAAVAGLVFTGLQLKVAQGQLEQASFANEKVNDALKVANRQADAAEIANKLNMEALSASDRPWIGVVATSPAAVDPNSSYGVTLVIKNYGKTPAINVKAFYEIDVISIGQNYPIVDLSENAPTFSVFPDNKLASFLVIEKEVIAASMDDIKIANKAVIVQTAMEYKDINARSHRYISCSMLVFTRNSFGYCPGFAEILE